MHSGSIAHVLHEAQESATSPLHSPLLGVLLLSAGIAGIDLATYHLNLPVVYIVSLLLIERMDRPLWLWCGAAAFVALTFVGFYFGNHPPLPDQSVAIARASLTNRWIAAVGIVLAAAILHIAIRVRKGMRRQYVWPYDPEGASFEQVIMSVSRVVAPLIAGLLTLILFIGDALSQPEYNVAVLYCLPLVVLARMRSAPAMWIALPILMLGAIGGLWIGPSLGDPAHFANLALNRAVACVALLAITLVVTARLAAQR